MFRLANNIIHVLLKCDHTKKNKRYQFYLMKVYFNHNGTFRKCDAETSKKVEMTTCATVRMELIYTHIRKVCFIPKAFGLEQRSAE